MKWQDIDGWFDWNDWMRDRIKLMGQTGAYVEVGCFLGRSTAATAEAIIESGKDIKIIAVDAWDARIFKNEPVLVKLVGSTGNFKMKFVRNMEKCGAMKVIEMMPFRSDLAADALARRGFGADIVFLDGDHTLEGILTDIKAWWPLLKPGGIMAGHDVRTYEQVWQAVKEAYPTLPDAEQPSVILDQNIWTMAKKR